MQVTGATNTQEIFFKADFFIRAWTLLSVCVCVFVLRECGTWIVPKKRTSKIFLYYFTMRMEILIYDYFRCTLFSVIMNKTASESKYLTDEYQIESDEKITLSSLSCVLNRFTLYSSSPMSCQCNVIFLPLHVEKLLILCLGNVVGYCQSSMRYVGFLSCCCVALSSLLYLCKSVKAPLSHSCWHKSQPFGSGAAVWMNKSIWHHIFYQFSH